ncbi:MAG: agmatine deiminase family protein [Bacteroidales bacterium]|nr:agmatine deiminase family protein [Bacteroidales bacterium]
MSTEFIIGTIIGLIGIIPVIIQVVKWVKKPKLSDLMKKLVDNGLSTKAQRKVLKKMNMILLRSGKHISSEYINNFVLDKRGKEAVFTDLCLQNDWEPTKDLCEMFMNGDYPSIRKKYWDMKNTQRKREVPTADAIVKVEVVLAQPKGREIVYLSELLKERFPDCFYRLTSILEKHNVEYRLLKGTKDIWCRDYMPIQTESGKLIQFRYDPSYLKGKKEWEDSRSDVREVCRQNGFEPVFSTINLDGGNVLLCSGRAIVSDRIFSENPEYNDKEQLIRELSELLEAEIIVIPAQKGDYTGHADGMVRFVNHDTILGNNRSEEYKNWSNGIEKVLKDKNIKYIDVPFFYGYKDSKHPENAIGIYVNYLEVGNLIVLPVFEVEGNRDAEAIETFKRVFPNKIIETINYNEIALEGGVLNCSTWNYRATRNERRVFDR